MKFAREKRYLLGILALVAPIPLPFNEVMEWPILGLYSALIGIILWRNRRGAEKWLPVWMVNGLGLVYLPILWIDLTTFGAGKILQPVLHLALYVTLVKLASFHRDVERWHIFGSCFFLFLAAMGTSVHPTIVLYLGLYVATSILVMAEFTQISVLSGFQVEKGEEKVSMKRFAVLGSVIALIFAAVIFPLIPRIDSPFFMPLGTGTGTIIHAAGFSDAVSLDAIGFSRQDQTTALRLRVPGRRLSPSDLRLKAATYELYNGRNWKRSPKVSNWDGLCQFMECLSTPGESIRKPRSRVQATMFLQPLGAKSLPLPVQFLAFESNQLPREMRGYWADRGGGLMLHRPPRRRLEFNFEFDPGTYNNPSVPTPRELEAVLDQTGNTPRIQALAESVMGTGGTLERIQNLEIYLTNELEYSDEFLGLTGDQPIEEFLFETQRGHCEFFASSMVIMLRSQGIPARLVTGFLGGEFSDIQDYFVVRQSNAHAWVEAWVPERGWMIFDPTPPSGLPTNAGIGWSRFRELMDNFGFFWDSWILTYGVEDQVSVFTRIGNWIKGWQRWLPGGDSTEAELNELGAASTIEGAEPSAEAREGLVSRFGPLVLVLLGAVILAVFYLRSLPPPSARKGYQRLLRRSAKVGIPIQASTTPSEFRDALEMQYPESIEYADQIIGLYLRESFNEESLNLEQKEAVKNAWVEVQTLLKKKPDSSSPASRPPG